MVVRDLTTATKLKEEVKYQGLTFIYFWADGAIDCELIGPMVHDLSGAHADVHFWQVDAGRHPELVRDHGLKSVPAFAMYLDGHSLGRLEESSVSVTRSALVHAIKQYGPTYVNHETK